jgi:hypothetical protein
MSDVLPLRPTKRKGTGRVPAGAIVKLEARIIAAAMELDTALVAGNKERGIAAGADLHAACAEYRKAITW